MELAFQDFVRKPFVVQAIEVTKENINQLAEELKIGEVRTKDDGTPFIHVDRRLEPNVLQVYPGYWVTQMGDNVRCYSRKVFFRQFIQDSDELHQWVDWVNSAERNEPPAKG